MTAVNSFLAEIKLKEEFRVLLKQIDSGTPLVPDWIPGEDVEAWKYQCALRKGYFLALAHFKISENKNE